MSPRIACALVLLSFAVGPFSAVASDPDCAHLEQQLAELTKRVQGLEKQLKAAQARLASTAKPAARPPAKKPGNQEIDPLYYKVDELLANGEIDAAKQALEERMASLNGQWTSLTKTLNRELGVVGEPTPDWAIEMWFQGESDVDLDSTGPTLLIFWESWCPHCRNEVPKVQKTYDAYKSQGLQVVGLTRLTRDSTEESVRDLIAATGVNYPIAKETGALAEYFHVKGIPAAAVVKDGMIIWRGHPLRLTDEMLKKWL